MSWLLGRKSELSLENKTLIYKCILKPIWTYGIQLWGCAKPSNTKIIQWLQSKVLRTITNAPWYVSNYTLHSDLQIPFITDEIKRYSTLYYNRLIGHENSYVTELRNPLHKCFRVLLVGYSIALSISLFLLWWMELCNWIKESVKR
jgi:hypothetical protein